jgi:broad specificity phosphatase PhoE
MHLILIRHGKPEVPTNGPTANPPLGQTGTEQAEHAARALAQEPIERIISSGMFRADATAHALSQKISRKIDIIEELGEIDRWGGEYASIETLRAAGGHEWQRFRDNPLGFFGIDADRFRAEVLAGFAQVLSGPERVVAIFTHGFPINILLAHALGIAHDARFVPSYASFTRLAGKSIDALTVVSVNESGHIPGALK